MTQRVGWALRALLAIALLPVCLAVSEAFNSGTLEARGAAASTTRLVILLVDSLAHEDVETKGRMPHLAALLSSRPAVHGPMSPCADAVTVPCFAAMVRGTDRQSMFALVRNLSSQASVVPGSLLADLKERKKRIGYIGDDIIGSAVAGLDLVEMNLERDTEIVARGLDALDRDDLDVVIIHTRETDETAHRKGGRSEEYLAVLSNIDRQVEFISRSLRPSDHWAVLGDHGHTLDGKHFAGLDVPSYAAYFGPRFDRALARPMTVTDQGALWAHAFGLGFGPHSWVDDYAAHRSVAIPRAPQTARGPAAPPFWAAGLTVLLAALAATLTTRPERFSSVRTLLLSAGLAVGTSWLLGSFWVECIRLIWAKPLAVRWLVTLMTVAVGVVLLWPLMRPRRPTLGHVASLGLTAVAIFALPTVYKHGGTFSVQSWFGLGILIFAARALFRRRVAKGLGILALWFPLWSIYNPNVNNFALRYFPAYSEFMRAGLLPLCLAFAAISLALAQRSVRDRVWLPYCVGVALCLLAPHLPKPVMLVLCLLACPLALWSVRNPRAFSWAIMCAMPAAWFFAKYDLEALGPSLAVLVLWSAVPARLRGHGVVLRATSLFVLLWFSLWASMGCRIAGLDFDYFFQFIPAEAAVTDYWFSQTVMTVCKYLLLPTLGLSLAMKQAPQLAECLSLASQLARARAAYAIVVLAALSQSAEPGAPFVVADIAQEASFAALMALFLWMWGCVATASNRSRTGPVGRPRPQPRDHVGSCTS